MCVCVCSARQLTLLLLKFFRHSAKSLNAQEERLATGDTAPPVARDSSEVARALSQRCYPNTGNDWHSWCLSSSLSLSVGFSIQDETIDVSRFAPQGAHYHAGVIYLLL